MARGPYIQTSFAAGMIDSALLGRIDVQAYRQGGKDITNMLSMPAGGVSLRPSMAYVDTIADGGDTARLVKFEFSIDQVYVLIFRELAIDVYLPDGTKTATINTTYTSGEIDGVAFTQSLDTLIIVHPDHAPATLQRQGSDSLWLLSDISITNIPSYPFYGSTAGTGSPSGTTGTITITSTEDDFANASVGDTVVINNGKATITVVSSDTSVTADVSQTLDDTDAADAAAWSVEQPVWSALRGWPQSVFLHQGRLYFGGSKSRPQSIWGSSSNDFFDFKTTTDALDDEAVELTMDNDRVCSVQQMYAQSNFLVFTTGGLFARVSSSIITPSDFIVGRQSEIEASNVRPVEIDGSVLFISEKKTGQFQSVYEAQYDYTTETYRAEDLATLSEALVRNPVDMAARRGNEENSAFHLFVVNNDGTAAVLNTRKSQALTAWTFMSTRGLIKRVAVVGGIPYFIAMRTINGDDKYFLEKLTFGNRLDAGKVVNNGTATDTFAGYDHLEGETVNLIGDGISMGTATVSGGEIKAPYDVIELEAGLSFDWATETMPVEIQGYGDGTLIGSRHRLTKASVRVLNTAGMTINNVKVADQFVGDNLLDQPPAQFSGIKVVRLRGYYGGRTGTDNATVRISGTSNNPATILAVSGEVSM